MKPLKAIASMIPLALAACGGGDGHETVVAQADELSDGVQT